MNTTGERLYTLGEFARMIGVKKKTVHTWKERGRIEFIQPGGPGTTIFISQREVDRLLQPQRQQVASTAAALV